MVLASGWHFQLQWVALSTPKATSVERVALLIMRNCLSDVMQQHDTRALMSTLTGLREIRMRKVRLLIDSIEGART